MRHTSEFLTCNFTWTTSIPQQAHGEVLLLTGVQGEGAGVAGLDGGVGGGVGFGVGVTGDGCGGGGRGAGGVSSRRFRLPKVSLFLTATGVTGGVVKLK